MMIVAKYRACVREMHLASLVFFIPLVAGTLASSQSAGSLAVLQVLVDSLAPPLLALWQIFSRFIVKEDDRWEWERGIAIKTIPTAKRY